MKITEHIKAISNQVNTHLSIPASYHIYNGNLALSNTVITAGMATTLYTGNGSTQSVVTGVDMASQWGNDASETFGGLVWCKSRSNALSNYFTDTIRGNTKVVSSDITNAEVTTTTYLTSFNNNGFSLGSGGLNANLATYASWVFQTTHRTSGVTNHGKAYTCHYNPFTGFTIVKYEGSGIAGHEIPHHLGRKLGLRFHKNLSAVMNWIATADSVLTKDDFLVPNLTDAKGVVANIGVSNESVCILPNATGVNTTTNQYILYGWANSYFDENSTLIGNYEIGTYIGTGVAGNKVTTRGKPAWVMVKSLSATGNWIISDNLRINASLYPNLANIEAIDGNFTYTNDGFTPNNGTALDRNTAGVTYLYMVVYDNDSGSGKSKYPRATDSSQLNLNAHIPYANGIDANGSKVTIAYKNETLTLSNALVEGKNYVYSKDDGTYTATPYAPSYGMSSYNGFGDYFDLATQKWFSSPSVFSDDFINTSKWSPQGGVVLSLVYGGMKVASSGLANEGFYLTLPPSLQQGQKFKLTFTVDISTSNDATTELVTYDYTNVYFEGSGTFSHTAVADGTHQIVNFILRSDSGYVIFKDIYMTLLNDDGSVDISGATPLTPRNYLDAIVYADAGGQPTYIEQLPKTQYVDDLVVGSAVINGEVIGQLGVNQTWQNVTASRVAGVTYTNTTGKPIEVLLYVSTTATSGAVYGYINGVLSLAQAPTGATSGSKSSIALLIPDSSTYQIVLSTATIITWSELR